MEQIFFWISYYYMFMFLIIIKNIDYLILDTYQFITLTNKKLKSLNQSCRTRWKVWGLRYEVVLLLYLFKLNNIKCNEHLFFSFRSVQLRSYASLNISGKNMWCFNRNNADHICFKREKEHSSYPGIFWSSDMDNSYKQDYGEPRSLY